MLTISKRMKCCQGLKTARVGEDEREAPRDRSFAGIPNIE